MTNLSSETIVALDRQNVQIRLAELEKQFLLQRAELENLKSEREKALKYGIVTLFTVVIGMVGWIVNLFTAGHIK